MKNLFKILVVTAMLFTFCSCSESDDDVSPDTIALGKSEMICSAEGEDSTVKLESSTDWKVSGLSSWCTINPSSGEAGKSDVAIKVKPNEENVSRTTSFIFTAGAAKDTLVIVQNAAVFLNVSVDALTFDQKGKTELVSIVASGAWTVKGETDWCTLDKTSGEGNGDVNVTTLVNKGEERTTTLVFTMGDKTLELVVTQEMEKMQTILEREKDALEAFYNATGGATWTENSNWLDDEVPVGEWYGVTTNDAGRVTSLRFKINNQKGNIPPEIGDLEKLEVLSINMAEFQNTELPKELGNLKELKKLTFRQCLLSGTIPAELGNLTNLILLDLESNLLTGSIPDEICNLTNLVKLDLFRNKLTGNIPSDLDKLVNLNDLMLGTNQLEGDLSVFCKLVKLEYLFLNSNKFSGEISSKIGDLTKLVTLNLSENNLSGSLPKELVASEVIDYFDVELNQLTGEIPNEILTFPGFTWTSKYHWNRIAHQQEGFGFSNSPAKPY